ncbi:MAG: hypothetical protein AAF573_02395 [Bacteroidota bacterium]
MLIWFVEASTINKNNTFTKNVSQESFVSFEESIINNELKKSTPLPDYQLELLRVKKEIIFLPSLAQKLSLDETKVNLNLVSASSPNYIDPPKKYNNALAIGFSYGLNRINLTAPTSSMNPEINYQANDESSVDYMSLNFSYYKNWRKNISLFSGLQVNQHTTLFELGESFEVKRSVESVLVEQHYLLSGLVDNIYGDGHEEYDVTVDSRLWQRYRSIAIPIGISIHSDLNKKFSVQNDLAIAFHPFQSIRGKRIVRTSSDYFVFDNTSFETNVFASVNNQLKLNWKLTDRWMSGFHLEFGTDLNSRLNITNHYGLQFSHFAVGLSGQYLF